MIIEKSIKIDAPVATVWKVFFDTQRWPDWTSSVDSVTALDTDEIVLGSRFRIKQPRLRAAIWTVTDYQPGVSWTWRANSPGFAVVAVHRVVTLGTNETAAEQTIEFSGLLAPLLGRSMARLTRRYLALEAAGLKAQSEALAEPRQPT
jgi:hypothetical protein